MPGFFAHKNILRTATVVLDETLVSYPFENALDGNTASRAGFSAGSGDIRIVEVDCGSSTPVDCLCVARHNLFAVGASIIIKAGSDGATWPTTLFSVTPESNAVLAYTAASQSFRYYQITISGQAATAYIADFFLGAKLDLQRSQRSGFEDTKFVDADEITPSATRGGNIVALNVDVNFKRVKCELHNYSAVWFDNNWASLKSSLKSYPVYFVWDDNKTPIYCWPKQNISSPAYGDTDDFISVTLDLEGLTE